MASTILNAQRGNDMVWLADASRGAKGLTCCVCEGRLKVCDGQGQYVKGKARRNVPKGKYFAHVGGGGCYGEGVVHHELKVLLAKGHQTAAPAPRRLHGDAVCLSVPGVRPELHLQGRARDGRFST